MKISDISIKRPVFATMMILALLVLGWFSYTDLSVQMFPDIDFPFVVVQTVYPGASAETIETDVTKKVEEAVNQISGIRSVQSKAQEGFTYTFVEFELEVDGGTAAQDVREKVAEIRADLPDDIEEPVITQFDISGSAIVDLSVSGQRSPREVTRIAKDWIKPRLETVRGVGSVELTGGNEREIAILLNPERMESYEITIDDVRNAVTAANLEIPGGRMAESSREYLVRVKGRLTSVDQFSTIIVKNKQGTPIYLSDVATVCDTIAEERSLSRLDAVPSVSIGVKKQSGANVVEIAAGVRAALEKLEKELPPDIKITVVNDDSVFIRDSISEILFNIQFGTLLAIIVIFLFLLDGRPTLITGLSIPISVIATFTALKFFGFSVNFMTLLGLSLAVGILIDDSIVVVENIYRKMQEGESPFKAAFSGTDEIGLAVAATTFSIVAVFLPVAFMQGIIGRIFYQFGMTVAFAVIISLFVAFSLVPMLTSRTSAIQEDPEAFNPDRATGWRKLWFRIRKPLSVVSVFFDSAKPAYRRLLELSLRHRAIVMVIAVGSFVLAIAAVGAGLLGMEFMASTDEGKVYVSVVTPPGSTLQQTSERIAQMETIVKRLPEVRNTFVTIGGTNTPVTEGQLMLLLTDAQSRSVTAQKLVDTVRTLISVVPGVKTSVMLEPGHAGSSKPVEFSIRGEDRDELTRLAHKVQSIVQSTPGTTDVDNSLEEGKPELHISVDRSIADDLGLNVYSISSTVRTLVEGEVVTQYQDGDQDYDVRVRLDERFRNTEQSVGRVLIASGKDIPGRDQLLIPLQRVARFDKETAIGEYSRYDRLPEVRVNANVLHGFAAGTVTNEVRAVVDSTIRFAPGYSAKPVGEQEFMEESFTSVARALILSIVFIYLLLASQYESFFDPLSIMLSLPLSLIGAILGLVIFRSTMNIMTMIGIVMLMGLVTKNAILLIDFVKQRRAMGISRTEAILAAGPIRLRPILMTTLATVFGMLPLALGIGPGAELRAAMARAVIGGLLSSTLLTLVVVPVVYTLIDDFVEVFRRRRSATAPAEVEQSTVSKS
jgi:hydrophobe/amphiphile efflux-1 (HAE1) family protein